MAWATGAQEYTDYKNGTTKARCGEHANSLLTLVPTLADPYRQRTLLLERGMPIEQIQQFLGHAKLETTQVYAESTPEMIKDSYRRTLAE